MSAPDASAGEGWETVELTYRGRRWSPRSLRPLHTFAPPGADPDDDLWYAKAPRGVVIGGVYAVERNAEGQAHITGAELVRTDDDPRVPEWRALDRGAAATHEAHRSAKRLAEANGDLGALTLAELRRLTARQPRHMRTGTIAAVLAYLDQRGEL